MDADLPVPSGTGAEPPSHPTVAGGDLGEVEPFPRVLTWAVVKRIDPRLLNTWGHWWIELDDDESYGWWPSPCPMGWRGAMLGSGGCLNGIDGDNSGTPTRDAYHGDEPDHWFHPTLIANKSDDQVCAEIRAFAHSYRGGFRWQWWWLREPADNCRTFQDRMFAAVGLFEEPEYLYTRGSGCPFMYPFRRVEWRISDAIADAVARVRRWSPRPLLRGIPRGAPEVADERTIAAKRDSGASQLPLTDPRARARARIRGTLLPAQRESHDA
jgi:hypothetical protein